MGQTTFTGPVISQNGFIDASFTTAERDAIVDPQPGLLIYNTTVNAYQVCTVGGGSPSWDTAFVFGPNITGVSPSSGPTGTSVTITGTGFTGATSVTFNANPASFTVNSDTQITATAPATGTLNPIDIVVTTPDGSSTEVAAFANTTIPTVTYANNINYDNGKGTANALAFTNAGGPTQLYLYSANWFTPSQVTNVISDLSGTSYTLNMTGGSGTLVTSAAWVLESPGVYYVLGTYTGTGSFVNGAVGAIVVPA